MSRSSDELIEQQREHFNDISERYYEARKHPNHLYLKKLVWENFFLRNNFLRHKVGRVLEPMCGMAEGYNILYENINSEFDYLGFDYSEKMVSIAKERNPNLRILWGDVTTYRADPEDVYDLIILIGGLHHVYSRTQNVLDNLSKSLGPQGYFLSFEPTHDNWLTRYVRKRIYKENALFDQDTEQGFEYRHLETCFKRAGFAKVDEVYPGLLAYIFYYNPDAFPSLNVGNKVLVKFLFFVDRLLWANRVGRKLSFATIGLWRKP